MQYFIFGMGIMLYEFFKPRLIIILWMVINEILVMEKIRRRKRASQFYVINMLVIHMLFIYKSRTTIFVAKMCKVVQCAQHGGFLNAMCISVNETPFDEKKLERVFSSSYPKPSFHLVSFGHKLKLLGFSMWLAVFHYASKLNACR
jgi:hypothetical protein